MDDLYDGFDINDAANTLLGDDNNYNLDDHTTATSNNAMLGTAFAKNESIRPMTSNKSAGYSSKSKKTKFESRKQNHAKQRKNEFGGNEQDNLNHRADEMEKSVNKMLKKSIFASANKDYETALDTAQKCRKMDVDVIIFREKHGLDENINSDLSFSVLFNLAHIYELKSMHAEAINIYNLMINDSKNSMNDRVEIVSRLRVNVGNIYYKQRKYDLAIKFYRMAMDQIGGINYKLKVHIMRNIGNSFIKLGQFVDAIQAFESILDLHCQQAHSSNKCDIQTVFNLIICYYALGDKEKMKKGFLELLNCSLLIPLNENNANVNDEYDIYIKTKWLNLASFIKQSVQLIGNAIANNYDEYSGYDWIIEHLHHIKSQHEKQSNKEVLNKIILTVIVSKGIAYLKDNKFKNAIRIFSELRLEKDECSNSVNANAHHNNLAFINFLKCQYSESNKFALSAVQSDRYNASALVNRANCLYVFGEYDNAKEMYLEAIGVEADCIEAIFNLGLICKKIGNYNDALQAFKKLNKIDGDHPRDPQILYQICNLYELLEDYANAIKWYKILHSVLPTDSFVLCKLANLYKLYSDSQQTQNNKDESLIFHQYLDAYKLSKCNINIISWLGIWYINNSLYENAIDIFKNAHLIQPKQIKWRLMIASCYRRMRNYQTAIDIYLDILNNSDVITTDITVKCLQYLCTIMKQIGHVQLEKYQNLLDEQLSIQMTENENNDQSMQIQQQQQQQREQEYEDSSHHQKEQPRQQEEEEDDTNWAEVDIDDELLPS